MKLARAIAMVGGLTMVSRVAGFIRDIMAAAILGAGPANDAFVVALKLPNLFRRLFAEGAFHVSFVPMFSGIYHAEGRDKAITFAEQALAVLLAILIPFSLLAVIFMPYIIPLIAPGFEDDPVRFEMSIALTRITFPYLAMISVVALLGGMLNALGRFGPFAEGPILFNACLISALVLAWAMPSVVSAAPAMSWAVIAAGVAQLLWLTRAVRQEGAGLRLIRPKLTPQVKKLLKLMAPGVIGAGSMQINILVDILFASFLPAGAISYLYYADRLNQLPLGVIGVAIGTTLLPMLSHQVKSGDKAAVDDSINRSLEFALMLTLPAAVALGVISHPIIETLFRRGNFSAADSVATAQTLTMYAIGIPAYVIAKVFSSAFFAREDTSSPVKMSIAGTIVNTVLAAILVWPLAQMGLALATSVAGWMQVGLLAWLLRKHGYLTIDARLKKRGRNLVWSSIVMGVVLLVSNVLLSTYMNYSSLMRISKLGIIMILGALAYFLFAHITGAISLTEIRGMLKRDKVEIEG